MLVPINFMLNAQEIAYILRSSGARALAVSDEFLDTGSKAAALDTSVSQALRLSAFDDLLSRDTHPPEIPVACDGLAQIVYTSGTESLPKGAMLTHDAVLWQYISCIVDAEIAASDVILHALPMYHCAQLDVFLGPAIYQGATNIIAPAPTPEIVLPLIAEHRITSFFAPPTVWIGLLRSPLFDQLDHSSLRKGYYGASIMPVEVLREIQRRVPELRLWNLYGQTEIAPLATVLGPDDQLRKPGSCGRPVMNVETRIVDDRMNDVKPGEVGEIVHRSPQLLSGYYDAPDKTASAFEGGWFHSGDLATVDEDGYITVVDRKKDMIKTGGENVASREVEEAIYRMPQVSEVAVIGLPDPKWIEAVTAVVVVKAGHALDAAGPRRALSGAPRRLQGAEARVLLRGAAEEPEREDPQTGVAATVRIDGCGPSYVKTATSPRGARATTTRRPGSASRPRRGSAPSSRCQSNRSRDPGTFPSVRTCTSTTRHRLRRRRGSSPRLAGTLFSNSMSAGR